MFRILLITLFLIGCQNLNVPASFVYKDIKMQQFDIASWQKITQPDGVYKIYLEGDGYAFNAHGRATQDPTPKGTLVREMAFGDKSPNVVYLARPCQYIKTPACTKKYWTTARFSAEVVQAEYEAIKKIVGKNPVILIGFSGGAQIAGLLAVEQNELNVKKVITIAGNLDHTAWTQYHHLPPLDKSLNLKDYRTKFMNIPQVHYIGAKDKVIPPRISQNFIKGQAPMIVVSKATHNENWKKIYPYIWAEK